MSPNLKIFSGWFFGGLIVGVGFLYIFNPLAGLTFLTLIVTGITMFVIPIIHIVMANSQEPSKTGKKGTAVALLIGILFIVVFALGATGIFNFT